jgi:polysaccharide deacetylase family protein (PEP-CTERM system associated)
MKCRAADTRPGALLQATLPTVMQDAHAAGALTRPPLMLSFDVEDWDQLVARNLGHASWDRRWRSFERQMRTIFDLLDEVEGRATFFLLGLTVKNYPDIIQEIVARGDEIASHGYGHEPVFLQTREQFAADINHGLEVIDAVAGVRPVGYRAPLFSINRDCLWALDVLAEAGFEYDSSQNDTPKVPRRIDAIPDGPYELRLASGRTLWEVPLGRVKRAGWSLPVGGGSYWRVLPSAMLRHAIRELVDETDSMATYFHPYEHDPAPLLAPIPIRPSRGQLLGGLRASLMSNIGRRFVTERFRTISRSYTWVTYHDALQRLRSSQAAGPRTLSPSGRLL